MFYANSNLSVDQDSLTYLIVLSYASLLGNMEKLQYFDFQINSDLSGIYAGRGNKQEQDALIEQCMTKIEKIIFQDKDNIFFYITPTR